MKHKASKRSLSATPADAQGSDEDGGSKKRVRWESRSDDEETVTITASEGTGREDSTTPDDEKVRLFLELRTALLTSRSRPPR